MRITTRGQLAVSAMTDLAMRQNTGPVALSTISARQGTSLSYLEQLFSALKRAGLVSSVRGPGGGYILAVSADEISIAQIIAAAEDKLDATQCSSKANCHNGAPCLTHDLWENLNKTINDYLGSVTLQHILDQQQSEGGGKIVTFTHIH